MRTNVLGIWLFDTRDWFGEVSVEITTTVGPVLTQHNEKDRKRGPREGQERAQ